ncbi:hypothetical protein VHUM_01379 [Vanrija humicola]|uniref:GYF domain-containing protein n=1 Tax=Vanrija humicola TaxID=5417 RepID=A0A7D8V3N4_VANHU|nr:hypothetical protein VHUM_01379 [Vanrija humicola]
MPVKRSGGAPSGAPKRTRFASPPPAAGPSTTRSSAEPDDEDQFLDADITESNRKAKSREKRALRDQDGYGSDSSNEEGESVVPSRRPGAKDDEDDDVDMFADEPAEDDKGKGKGKEKAKEFMDLNEFEGQEFGRNNANDDDDSDSDIDEAKKKKTGLDGDMGVDITPFNMKNEMQEGRFTADGETYVENDKDPHEKHDNWLDDANKEAIKKARRAHRERERVEREREQREADIEGAADTEEKEHDLLRQAVDLMERGETVLEALQRLGKDVEAAKKKEGAGPKKSWAERQRERKALMAENASDPTHTANPFTNLSNIVSALSSISNLDVYSLSREAIQRMLPREQADEAAAPAAPRPPPDTRQLEYRFSLNYMRTLPEGQRPVEREVFGPFPIMQLRGWKATGFFGPNCENIELRVVKPEEGEQPWGLWGDVIGA